MNTPFPTRLALSALVLGVLAAGQAQAAPQRFNGTGNNDDRANAIAVDDAGYVYVTGYQWGGPTTDADILTLKYASNGALVWARVYDGPVSGRDMAMGLAVDASGNVYVTGSSEGGAVTEEDYVTLKYATNGLLLWVRRYNGPGNGFDGAMAVAVDNAGNVCVSGWSTGAGTDLDYATIKYAPNGDMLWVNRYNGPGNGRDRAGGLAVDAAGQVYVTGASDGGPTQDDYATIKYAPNGVPIWVRRYDGPVSGHDSALDLAVDNDGNALVTGSSTGGFVATDYDYATIKYAPNGDTLWVSRYNGPGNGVDYATHLAVDAAGHVYVTGRSTGLGTGEDYATICYAPNGLEAWVRRYNGPGSGSDMPVALKLDAAGNVCITGGSWGGPSGWDYATLKYAPNGVTIWERRYLGPVGSDSANGLAVDAAGNVYVTGVSEGVGTRRDFLTVKYAPNGFQLW